MLVVKNAPANAGDTRDMGLIPGFGRSPRVGNGNLLQYACLENPMERGAWRAKSMGPQRVRHNWACTLHVVHWSPLSRLLLLVHGELMAFTMGWLKFYKNEIIPGYGFLTVDRMTAYIQRNWLRTVNYGRREKRSMMANFIPILFPPQGHADRAWVKWKKIDV